MECSMKLEQFNESKRIAKERPDLHKGQSSHRPLRSKKTEANAPEEDYELTGFMPEVQFAKDFGVKVDKSLRVDGDKGMDFRFSAGTVDVKGAKIPNSLLVEEGHVRADIFVLYGVEVNTQKVWFVGWAYKEEVLKKEPKQWPQKVINHIVPKKELRSKRELRKVLELPPNEDDIFEELGL